MSLDKNRKSYGTKPNQVPHPYRWQPLNDVARKTKQGVILISECTAIPYSQGEDYTTTYVYDKVLVGGVLHKLAYVECDYVE